MKFQFFFLFEILLFCVGLIQYVVFFVPKSGTTDAVRTIPAVVEKHRIAATQARLRIHQPVAVFDIEAFIAALVLN